MPHGTQYMQEGLSSLHKKCGYEIPGIIQFPVTIMKYPRQLTLDGEKVYLAYNFGS